MLSYEVKSVVPSSKHTVASCLALERTIVLLSLLLLRLPLFYVSHRQTFDSIRTVVLQQTHVLRTAHDPPRIPGRRIT